MIEKRLSSSNYLRLSAMRSVIPAGIPDICIDGWNSGKLACRVSAVQDFCQICSWEVPLSI
jgi:hypothetical protein